MHTLRACVLRACALRISSRAARDRRALVPACKLAHTSFYAPALALAAAAAAHPFSRRARFPTLVIFAAGGGIATAAALVESPLGAPTHLGLPLRADVRLFYVAPNRASLALTEKFDGWAERYNVTVVPTTAGFMDAWDEDDSLVYDPATTAAIVLSEFFLSCFFFFVLHARLVAACMAPR